MLSDFSKEPKGKKLPATTPKIQLRAVAGSLANDNVTGNLKRWLMSALVRARGMARTRGGG